MSELLTMSQKELTRLEAMQRLDERRMEQSQAVEQLGISTRPWKQ